MERELQPEKSGGGGIKRTGKQQRQAKWEVTACCLVCG